MTLICWSYHGEAMQCGWIFLIKECMKSHISFSVECLLFCSLYSLTFPSEGSVRIVDCFVCVFIPMCSLWPSFSLTLIVNLIPGVLSSPIILCLKSPVFLLVFVRSTSSCMCLQTVPVCITLDLIVLKIVAHYSSPPRSFQHRLWQAEGYKGTEASH